MELSETAIENMGSRSSSSRNISYTDNALGKEKITDHGVKCGTSGPQNMEAEPDRNDSESEAADDSMESGSSSLLQDDGVREKKNAKSNGRQYDQDVEESDSDSKENDEDMEGQQNGGARNNVVKSNGAQGAQKMDKSGREGADDHVEKGSRSRQNGGARNNVVKSNGAQGAQKMDKSGREGADDHVENGSRSRQNGNAHGKQKVVSTEAQGEQQVEHSGDYMKNNSQQDSKGSRGIQNMEDQDCGSEESETNDDDMKDRPSDSGHEDGTHNKMKLNGSQGPQEMDHSGRKMTGDRVKNGSSGLRQNGGVHKKTAPSSGPQGADEYFAARKKVKSWTRPPCTPSAKKSGTSTYRSPVIRVDWGKTTVDVDGTSHTYKDAKVGPHGCREWDWGEHGTHHKPGIQIADIEEILQQEIDILVLSRGFDGVLGVTKEVIEHVKKRNVRLFVEKTPDAVKKFNGFGRQGKRVGAVIHSTC